MLDCTVGTTNDSLTSSNAIPDNKNKIITTDYRFRSSKAIPKKISPHCPFALPNAIPDGWKHAHTTNYRFTSPNAIPYKNNSTQPTTHLSNGVYLFTCFNSVHSAIEFTCLLVFQLCTFGHWVYLFTCFNSLHSAIEG